MISEVLEFMKMTPDNKNRELDEKNVEDILALSPLQEGMLYHYLRDPDSDIYFGQLCLEISGEINNRLFEKAWNFVVETNEMLRVIFRWENLKHPLQIILKNHKTHIQYIVAAGRDTHEKIKQAEDIRLKDRKDKFDWQDVPFRVTLCKEEENRYRMIVNNHHILYDGWSNGIILKEFFQAYENLHRGKQLVKIPKTKFKEFVKWNQEQDTNPGEQEKYWENYLQGYNIGTKLQVRQRREREEALSAAARDNPDFAAKVTDNLEDFVKKLKITLASVLYSAWGILLQTYNNTDDTVFGTTVSGRSARIGNIESMVGLFINTIPLRVQTFPHETTADFLYRINNVIQARQVYEHTPLVKIKEYSEIDTHQELFDTVVVIENYPLDMNRLFVRETNNLSLSVESFRMFEMTQYDLTVSVSISIPGEITVNFSYNRELFETRTIERLANHYLAVMGNMLRNPAKPVSEIGIISRQEKRQVLYDFNKTEVQYPRDKSPWQLIKEQAGKSPDSIAVTGRASSPRGSYKGEETAITYRELHGEADRLARLLRKIGVRPNTIVGVMLERSLEMVSGILAVLNAGGAYLPIEADYPGERIRCILEDSESKILLTRKKQAGNIEFNGIVIDVEEKVEVESAYLQVKEDRSFEGSSSPGDLIYVIYTSGSTGRPKGVMVKTTGFVNLLNWYTREFRFTDKDTVLLIAPIGFDLAQKNLFAPLIIGGCLCLASPGLMDYHELSGFIAQKQVTITNCAPSVFYPIIEFNIATDFNQLRSLRFVFLGGEAIQGNRLLPWVKSVSFGCEIVNTYGPTECTDIASFYRVSPRDIKEQAIIPIGRPIDNVKLFILDRNRQVLPVGLIGEICIGGIGLSKGYYNNDELTGKKFINSPHLPVKMIYRTGDLGYWLPDGNIEFSGRLDNQIKIRGFRIEPGEIEKQLLRHADIKDVAVIDQDVTGAGKYLCAYIISEKQLDLSGLKEYLSASLPDYMIPAYFIRLEKIPLTPHGKVDRKSLPEPVVETRVEYTAPGDEVEQELVEIWWEVLFARSAPARAASRTAGEQSPENSLARLKIGVHDNFFRLGGHSLTAARLQGRIQKEFSVKVPLGEIFENPYIRDLATFIKNAVKDSYQSIEAVEAKEYYALSSAQQRLYLLDRMELERKNTGYNISGMFLLGKKADRIWWEDIFRTLIRRHESLRTSFHQVGEMPVQKIHDEVEFEMENCNLTANVPGTERISTDFSIEEEPGNTGNTGYSHPSSFIIQHFIRPFDLSQAPLLRVGLLLAEEGNWFLMVDMHHIISDGFSIGIMLGEMVSFIDLDVLPPIQIQYKDYCRWQKREIETGKIQSQKVYWLKEFPGEIPVLDLPYDYVRPGVQDFSGSAVFFRLGVEETLVLKKLAQEEGVTLYMIIFAVYNILLAKLGSQEDIVVGSPVAGRRHADLEHVVGMFVNTLALRNFPSGEKTFNGFLREIKEKTIEAFQNQDYPFEDLVGQVTLNINRDMGRNPLFDVFMSFQDMKRPETAAPGLKLTAIEFELTTSKFDMALQGFELLREIGFTLEYRTKLFRRETISRFAGYFLNIIKQVSLEPGMRISAIDMLPGEEKNRLLVEFNETRAGYPSEKTIVEIFADRVKRGPDTIAVVGLHPGEGAGGLAERQDWPVPGNISISYDHLNCRADELAFGLKEEGVGPDTIVGLSMERSLELVIAQLAILKAGGGYLPLDPDYPQERVDFMLKDSGAGICLTRQEVSEFSSPHGFTHRPDTTSSHLRQSPGSASGASLAYVIYTSGSTGKPKGTLIEHRNVVSRVTNPNYIDFLPGDRLLMTGAVTFDITTFEIWGALLNGISLYIPGGDTILEPGKLGKVIIKNGISILHLVPQLFNRAAGEDIEIFSGLRCFLVGGDLVKPSHINELREKNSRLKILHMYGPTENTVFSTYFPVERGCTVRIPIGKPVSHSQVYILDRNGNLQPIGVVGELCTGGAGVARGYLNKPELTIEKFTKYKLQNNQKLLQKMAGPGGGTTRFLEKSPPGRRRQIMYRTGDLARWLAGGNIEFLARVDRQVKIRGIRIEPGEIEKKLIEMDFIRDAVVIDREDGKGEKYLAAYLVSNRDGHETTGVSGLRGLLSEVLPAYMIPSFFVYLEEIPVTPNGKVDRKSLPDPWPGIGLEYVAPGDETEEKIAEIWAAVLGLDKTVIGIDNSFFELGGHSLTAILLLSRLHKEFSVRLSLGELFKNPFIRRLSVLVKSASKESCRSIEAVEAREYYALSSGQQRLYLLDQMELESKSTGYNISGMFLLGKKADRIWWEDIFRTLIRRHESLRTSFHQVGEMPVQKIHGEVEIEMENCNLTANVPGTERISTDFSIEEEPGNTGNTGYSHPSSFIIQHFIRPFDLSQAPLLRVGLLLAEEGNWFLMVDMHHIISDGFSIGIMLGEMASLYDLDVLPPIQIQYKDYCRWQKREIETGKIQSQKAYWLNEFPGEIPVLDLPYDYVRPGIQDFSGSSVFFRLGVEETLVLKKLAQKEGVTLYMIILAVYNILLAKLGSQEDIVVGSPVAGRRHADLEHIVGMFVNTLALRNFPSGEKTFNGFLREIKEKTIEAFQNQDYPFEDLVGQVTLNINRDMGRNPLFDVFMSFQDMKRPGTTTPGLKLTTVECELTTSKFDMALQGFELLREIGFTLEYKTKLFRRETISRFAGYFLNIIKQVSLEPGMRISAIDMLPVKEKNRLLVEFNETRAGYPSEKTIVEIFADRVKSGPDNIAMVGLHPGEGAGGLAERQNWPVPGNISISCDHLNCRADELALGLKEGGFGPDTIVGLAMERSLELVIAQLAILKAGGGYLPLDPDYPQERVDFMLKDSGAGICLTRQEVSEFSSPQGFPHRSDTTSSHLRQSPAPVSGASLAYVIYTSGSTGKPKGTLIEHRNVVSRVTNPNYIDFLPGDRLLMTGAVAFDITTFEIWGALLNAISLYIPGANTILEPGKLRKVIKKNGISILHLVPQLFNRAAGEDIEIFSGLRCFLVGGDLVKPLHINELREKISRLKILHMYGPTENTVFSTYFPVARSCTVRIPIGKSVSHSQVYILDRKGNLQPIGVAGELCTGGAGVARGYLNKPELTMKKFINKKLQNNQKLLRKMAGPGGGTTRFLEKSPPGRRRQRMYRTGDLARWLPDGNIEFLARVDRQVKIRGIRIEPGEIERKLVEMDFIRDAVVIDREDSKGEKYLAAYLVLNRESHEATGASGLRRLLSEAIPAYMIPSYFVYLEEIPLTPNGKVDRKSLPEPVMDAGVDYTAPRNEVERRLVKIFSEILGRDSMHASQLQASIGIHHNFFELGGHSLKAAILLSRMCKTFNINFSLSKIFSSPTVRELAHLVENSTADIDQDIKPIEKKEYYSLSSAQKRLFFLDQLEDIGISYNIPSVLLVRGKPGKEKFEECFKALIHRHEALRTSFVLIDNQPVQWIHHEVEFKMDFHEHQGIENLDRGRYQGHQQVENIIEEFVRPFNLAEAPLLRVRFISFPGDEGLLLVDIHHIIGDGTSMGIFIADFKQLYTDEELPLLKIQYKDFSLWQNNLFETGKIKAQEDYWLNLLAGEIPVLNLLPDHPRPPVLSFAGGYYTFYLDKENTEKFRVLGEEIGATLYMNLLTALNILLFKYTGQEDIIVGSGIMGRPHVDLQKIIGMFVNTLPMRNYPQGHLGYWDFFRQVKENSLDAFENQDVQFEELVRLLNLERDPSRNPIFDITFVVQNFERSAINLPGMVLEPYEMENKNSKFDLTLFVYEDEIKHCLIFDFEYAARLFERKTVEKISRHFIEIIKQVIRDKYIKINDIVLQQDFLDSQSGSIKDEEGDFGF